MTGARAAAIAAAMLAGGCATMFAGGPDRVKVRTTPEGALVYLNGAEVGEAPTEVVLARNRPAYIQIYLPGYRAIELQRYRRYNGWFFANFCWAATIVPIVVDLVTDNWQRYDTTDVAVMLVPDSGPPPRWYRPYVYPTVDDQRPGPAPARPPERAPEPPPPPPVAPPPVAPAPPLM